MEASEGTEGVVCGKVELHCYKKKNSQSVSWTTLWRLTWITNKFYCLRPVWKSFRCGDACLRARLLRCLLRSSATDDARDTEPDAAQSLESGWRIKQVSRLSLWWGGVCCRALFLSADCFSLFETLCVLIPVGSWRPVVYDKSNLPPFSLALSFSAILPFSVIRVDQKRGYFTVSLGLLALTGVVNW